MKIRKNQELKNKSIMTKLVKEVKEILITEAEIKSEIKKFAPKLNEYYKNKEKPVILGVLKGCVLFQANLVIYFDFDAHYEFVSVKRTENNKLKDKFELEWLTKGDVEGKNILIVEDVVDSAITLKKLQNHLLEVKKAKEVKTVTLIDKPHNRKTDFEPDWKVIKLDTQEWLIGWGFDYNERLRNLPYIASVKKEYKSG